MVVLENIDYICPFLTILETAFTFWNIPYEPHHSDIVF